MNKNIITGISSVFILTALFQSCKSTTSAVNNTIEKKSYGIQTEYMDKSVKPNEDFYNYVNGTWLKNTEIPADRTRWGSFDELRKNTDNDVMAILNEAVQNKNLDPKSDQAKAVNLYKSILDTVTRNKKGIEPLKPYLAKIESVKNTTDLMNLLAENKSEASYGFFGAFVSADAKNSNKNVVYVGTGSVGLPDKDYYVSDKPDNKEKREKYVVHVSKMLRFLGDEKLQL